MVSILFFSSPATADPLTGFMMWLAKPLSLVRNTGVLRCSETRVAMEISFLNARLVRLLIFLVLVSFMTAEPLYHYGRVGMRDWRMFDGAGWGVVDARFTQVLYYGNEVVLDRLKLLKKKYKNQTLQERERNNVWLIQEKRGVNSTSLNSFAGSWVGMRK